MAVTVKVPATTANLGSGFDAVGMALGLYNTFCLEQTGNSFEVVVNGEGAESISRGRDNLFFVAMEQVYKLKGQQLPPWRLVIENTVPTGRGLGSSATAIVGGLVAANWILGSFLSRSTLIALATQMEGHPDNVAPAVMGGVVVAVDSFEESPQVLQLPYPEGLQVVVAVPTFELHTSYSRSVLPQMVPFQDAVFNAGRAALLGGVLATGQWGLLRTAMQDRLHQDYRKKLIPGLDNVFEAALAAGALGVSISGAGPSVLALAIENFAEIGDRMKQAFRQAGVSAQILTVPPAPVGAHIIEEGVSHADYCAKVWR